VLSRDNMDWIANTEGRKNQEYSNRQRGDCVHCNLSPRIIFRNTLVLFSSWDYGVRCSCPHRMKLSIVYEMNCADSCYGKSYICALMLSACMVWCLLTIVAAATLPSRLGNVAYGYIGGAARRAAP
jgi:hypothetical protein